MRARCLLYGRDKNNHESEKGGKNRPLRKLTSRIARKAKGPNFDRGRGRPPYLTAESKEKLREWMGECAMTHKCPLFQPEGQGAEAAPAGKRRQRRNRLRTSGLWCLTSYNILSVNFPSFLTQLCSLYAPIFVFSLYSGQFPSPEIYNFRKMYV